MHQPRGDDRAIKSKQHQTFSCLPVCSAVSRSVPSAGSDQTTTSYSREISSLLRSTPEEGLPLCIEVFPPKREDRDLKTNRRQTTDNDEKSPE